MWYEVLVRVKAAGVNPYDTYMRAGGYAIPRDLMVRRASVHAFTLWGLTDAERLEVGAALAAGLDNRTLRPVVGKKLPLAEAARAHVEVMAAGAYGKIVLLP